MGLELIIMKSKPRSSQDQELIVQPTEPPRNPTYFIFIIILFLRIPKFISSQYCEILLCPGLDTASLTPSICTLLVGIPLLYMSSNILNKPSALLSTHEYTCTRAHTQTHTSDVYVKADVPNFHTLSSQWQAEKNSRKWVKEKTRCIFGTWRMTPKAEVREREHCMCKETDLGNFKKSSWAHLVLHCPNC